MADEAPFRKALGEALVGLLRPVPFIALLILFGVLMLLGAAVTGFDKGEVLLSMRRAAFARGLITYLFALVTIGTAVCLVVSALIGGENIEKRFEQGKDILGLLLGVFGTIVGFYFGSELAQSGAAERGELAVTTPLVSPAMATSGQTLAVTTAVRGGIPPYRFGLGVGDEKPVAVETVRSDGWAIGSLQVPSSTEQSVMITVMVIDAEGETVLATARVPLQASATPPPK
jgi:hypothetical protein